MATQQDIPSIELRDVHVPAGVDAWPLAAGWWLLVLLVLIALAALGWRAWQRRPRTALRAPARRRLEAIVADNQLDAFARFIEISSLLRRLARVVSPGPDLAADRHGQWLERLSRRSGVSACPHFLQEQVANATFQRPHRIDCGPLVAQARAIVAGLPARYETRRESTKKAYDDA